MVEEKYVLLRADRVLDGMIEVHRTFLWIRSFASLAVGVSCAAFTAPWFIEPSAGWFRLQVALILIPVFGVAAFSWKAQNQMLKALVNVRFEVFEDPLDVHFDVLEGGRRDDPTMET